MTQFKDIIHITDCHDTNPEGGQLAATKVKLAYSALARSHGILTSIIDIVPTEEFNTIDVGAKFSELAISAPDPKNLIIAINAAPPSIPGGNNNNARKNFVLGRLENGIVFGGTWGGHCLSYVKSQITELHELTDSNNGSQFRSLEVLPPALVEFAAGTIDTSRLLRMDAEKQIPAAPNQSHAYTIDNFGNVKLALTEDDYQKLSTIYNSLTQSTADDFNVEPHIKFAFGAQSIEFQQNNAIASPLNWIEGVLHEKLFSAVAGSTVITLNSSSRRWSANGKILPIVQLATLRTQPGQAHGYALPKIGAPIYFPPTH